MFKRFRKWVHGPKRDMAKKADSLLRDEAFLTAKESLQERLLQEWAATKPCDREKREEIYGKYRLADDLVFELVCMVDAFKQEKQQEKDNG